MEKSIEQNIIEISERLKKLRKQNNLEQIDVARHLNYKSDSTIFAK